jgi:predicted Zn-dependent protease
MMIKRSIIFLFSLLIGAFFSTAYAQQSDALLQILQEELQKNKAILDQQQSGVYLLSYRVDETTYHYVNSSMGSLLQNRHQTQRLLTVQVRVGDHELDNFHELRDDYSDRGSSYSAVVLPITDEPQAIAQLIWSETDKAFREAKQRYEKVKANVAVKVDADDHAPDYSNAAQETYFEPALIDNLFVENEWIERLKELSSVFTKNPDAQTGTASINYTIQRKYFVNSEGTYIVQNYTSCHLFLNVEGQAEDGMFLPLFQTYFTHTPDQMPAQQELMTDAQTLNDKISRLVKAPVAEAYTGPALLSKEAAGVFFHEIFGHRVEGQRLKQSTDGQTFKQMLHQPVLSPDISVFFDPSLQYYKGLPLNGNYKYDDEGFLGYRVPVVENGVLKNFLMTRTPIDHFPLSNGHARAEAGYQPVSRQSNLIVETSHPYTDEQLRAMLIAEAKAQGKEYGYLFERVQGGFTTTGRYMPNAFNVTPIEVYRIYVDGRPDELVRGVDLVGTPLAMFSKVEAAGNEHGNFAGSCGAESGYVPVACCSPALFVKQIETQKKNKSQQRPPVIPKDLGRNTAPDNSFESVCFEAMEDELEQNMTALRIDGLQAPYFISYLISDAKITSILTSLGGVVDAFQIPYRDKEVNVLVGSDKLNNQHYFDLNQLIKSGQNAKGQIAINNDYCNIRQNLWLTTDFTYKNNAEQLEAKKAAIQQQNIPQQQLDRKDRSEVVSQNFMEESQSTPIDMKHYEAQLSELSKRFARYPDFINSGVNLYAFQANAYYMDSEGLKYKQPFNLVCVNIYAEAQTDDGEPIADAINIYRNDIRQLPSMEELEKLLLDFANRLDALRKAEVMAEIYNGPVIFADEAAAVLIAQSFFENTDGLLASRKPIFSSPEVKQMYGQYADKDNPTAALMNKKIISRDLTIESRNTLTQYNGIPLIGSYQHDAEGVAAEDQQLLVENGVLLQLLSDRQPAEQADYSNGHRRLALSRNKLTTALGPGVVQLSGKNKSSYKQLKKKLISLAKAEDYDYCYIVTKLAGSDLQYSPGMDKYMTSSGTLHPLYCYRINVKTGTEELVRMVKMPAPRIKNFRHLSAVSNEQQVYNTMLNNGKSGLYPAWHFYLFGIPASFILPQALLFEELEINKDTDVILQKEPFRPNPLKD